MVAMRTMNAMKAIVRQAVKAMTRPTTIPMFIHARMLDSCLRGTSATDRRVCFEREGTVVHGARRGRTYQEYEIAPCS